MQTITLYSWGLSIKYHHMEKQIPTFEEMIEALNIDMENAEHMDISKE